MAVSSSAFLPSYNRKARSLKNELIIDLVMSMEHSSTGGKRAELIGCAKRLLLPHRYLNTSNLACFQGDS
jgi:hypothetical protein